MNCVTFLHKGLMRVGRDDRNRVHKAKKHKDIVDKRLPVVITS